MKGYTRFIIAFAAVLLLYVLAEINRPKPVNWKESLSKDEKSPYGSYILYKELGAVFPRVPVNAFRQPVYNQVNNFTDSNTAYLLIEPKLEMDKNDLPELLQYAAIGNYVFIAAEHFSKLLMDTLQFTTARRFDIEGKDSTSINFSNPLLKADSNYSFMSMTLGGYISKMDTAHTTVLGLNQLKDVNFIKIAYGKGAFFVHAAPLCFSNYFMLTATNAGYTAKALSYIPSKVKYLYWDEYYKLGPEGVNSPLRFLLSNTWLKWAFRIGVVTILLFVLFEMKRRQRVIPVIMPPRNTTLDFVETVGSVYFNQHNNKNIAFKKISYFMEFVRTSFYLSTSPVNEEFIITLAKKSGVSQQETAQLMQLIEEAGNSAALTDQELVQLNNHIDLFYAKAK